MYAQRLKAGQISLFVGISMLIMKFGAYLLTGSAAIFSDALESVVHIAATSMALFSIIYSSKPPDKEHPYGHGNMEYFSAGVEGLLILIAAIGIIYYATMDIIYPPEIKKLDIGMGIIAFAGLINLFLGLFLIRTGKKTNSITLIADGKHVLTDSYTSLGVIIGLTIVYFTDFAIIDPLFAIFVGMNIIYTGYKLLREAFGGLMHEADPATVTTVSNEIVSLRKEDWIDVHELRCRRSGSFISIDFHLILPFYRTIKESHDEETRIKHDLREKFSESDVKIHFDYCQPKLCKYCSYANCADRAESHSVNFDWNEEKTAGRPIYEFLT
ncbi:MAG: cation transporter [Ignavibacteria bacterium]|nr:cation transporter [Ignavibacteria bacterium]